MDANEVYSVLDGRIQSLERRHDNHETHCQERQREVYNRIGEVDKDLRSLSKIVYVGIGILIVLEFAISIFSDQIQSIAGG